MDNIREITSVKRAALPLKVENVTIKKHMKKKSNIQTQELQNLIATHINESIAAAAETKKTFWKKVREYIGLKHMIRIIIVGILTTAGGTIVTFKWAQIHSYTSFIPNVIQAKTAMEEMHSLCYRPVPLNAYQYQKFLKNKDDFDKYTKNIFNSGYYSFKKVLFGKNISAKETELSNDLMNIDTILTDCRSVKAINPVILNAKESDIANNMLWSIALRWPPFLF